MNRLTTSLTALGIHEHHAPSSFALPGKLFIHRACYAEHKHCMHSVYAPPLVLASVVLHAYGLLFCPGTLPVCLCPHFPFCPSSILHTPHHPTVLICWVPSYRLALCVANFSTALYSDNLAGFKLGWRLEAGLHFPPGMTTRRLFLPDYI